MTVVLFKYFLPNKYTCARQVCTASIDLFIKGKPTFIGKEIDIIAYIHNEYHFKTPFL